MSTFKLWLQWAKQVSLDQMIYGNPLSRWLTALAVFLVVLVVLRMLKTIMARRVHKVAERFQQPWAISVAELIQATKFWFLLILSLYFGSLALSLPGERVLPIVRSVVRVALLIQAGLWGTVLLMSAISRYAKERLEVDAASVTTVSALGFVGKLAIWSLVGLMTLAEFGVDVTALVAGLGVGGIAVALAAQNILGDLFASLSIVLDKPFVLGDFIIVGDYMGNVEHVGLKTTRIRSLSGEQLVFSNNDLLQSRIRNYKRMQERRVAFTIGITYETPYAKVESVPRMIRETIESQKQTRFDRAHFKQYGDFALIYEAVYYVLMPDYTLYMDIQQSINLALHRRFETEGIDFAYPTQTVHLRQQAPVST